MTAFNAQKARTKHAVPMWADALLRDTLELAGDEIGAYHLILYAMWARESCDLMDDDRKLARVARTTPQTWKRRIRPVLEEFFEVENGVWTSRRLRREAAKVEKFLTSQSQRRKAPDEEIGNEPHQFGAQLENSNEPKESDKPLKSRDPASTADQSPEHPADPPIQETNIRGGGGDARARASDVTDRERLVLAVWPGADPVSGLTGYGGQRLGSPGDMVHAVRWRDDLGLTLDEQIAVIRDVMARKPDGPPARFSYFTPAMQRFAATKAEGPLSPTTPHLTSIPGGRNDRRAEHQRFDASLRETTRRIRAGEVDLGTDDGDPWAGR